MASLHGVRAGILSAFRRDEHCLSDCSSGSESEGDLLQFRTASDNKIGGKLRQNNRTVLQRKMPYIKKIMNEK